MGRGETQQVTQHCSTGDWDPPQPGMQHPQETEDPRWILISLTSDQSDFSGHDERWMGLSALTAASLHPACRRWRCRALSPRTPLSAGAAAGTHPTVPPQILSQLPPPSTAHRTPGRRPVCRLLSVTKISQHNPDSLIYSTEEVNSRGPSPEPAPFTAGPPHLLPKAPHKGRTWRRAPPATRVLRHQVGECHGGVQVCSAVISSAWGGGGNTGSPAEVMGALTPRTPRP